MSTKTSAAQPPGRRTPLSLNAATKQINKPTNDNKKESNTNNNQKTENSKKDSQPEKKISVEKKQSSSESRKPSSSDSKKTEEIKIIKHDESKKNQNGVNTNGGVKEKEKQNGNGNEGTIKPKPDTSAGSSTPKKEMQKTIEKKKEISTEVVAKEDNKSKVDEKNKEKTNENNTKKLDEKKKEKERKEDANDVEKKKIDVKLSQEKTETVKSFENAKTGIASGTKLSEIIDLDSSEEDMPSELVLNEQSNKELVISKTPVKEKKVEQETSKLEEKQVQSPAEQLEDVEMMEPLIFEAKTSPIIFTASTPAKSYDPTKSNNRVEEPPKTSPKSEVKPPRARATHTPDRKSCPKTFSSISGRRSIRPIGDYAFSGNLRIRESYRQINTELDFTTSSLNVTVGSEVPNESSFSFFGVSRKRERSSPARQSTMELQGDISPKSPKRARIDIGMAGFLNAMASPITMLRARFSRASVQSTPKKQISVSVGEDIVENVSGISVEEQVTTTDDLTVNPDSTIGNDDFDVAYPKCEVESSNCLQKPAVEEFTNDDDIKIKETITTTDSQAKKKCSIM